MKTFTRDTNVTITNQEWVRAGDITWLTVKTAETGGREFRLVGLDTPDYAEGMRCPDWEERFAVDKIVKIGELHDLPCVAMEWLACIRPGVNLHVGLVDDGLWYFCGHLAFARIVNMIGGDDVPFDDYAEIAQAAIRAFVTGGEKAAKRVLWDFGLFTSVYKFNIGGPSLDTCFEV